MTDPAGGLARMQDWVRGFPGQIRAALSATELSGWPPPGDAPRHVLICGMGGLAMAGDVARSIVLDRLSVPLVVARDPEVPAWVGPGTLVLAISYSGRTWETLRAVEEAANRGARVAVIASGGTLADRAVRESWPMFSVAGGYAPRAALGWMATAATLGAISGAPSSLLSEVRRELAEAADILEEEIARWKLGGEPGGEPGDEPGGEPGGEPAGGAAEPRPIAGRDPEVIAASVAGRFAFIYAPDERMCPAANRWRGQLQENAKQAAAAMAFPEAAHNEITGWRFSVEALPSVHVWLEKGREGVLAEERGAEDAREAHAHAAAAELESCGARLIRVPARGRGTTAQLFSHVLLADAVSVEVARRRGIDPLPVEAIERVKRAAAR